MARLIAEELRDLLDQLQESPARVKLEHKAERDRIWERLYALADRAAGKVLVKPRIHRSPRGTWKAVTMFVVEGDGDTDSEALEAIQDYSNLRDEVTPQTP